MCTAKFTSTKLTTPITNFSFRLVSSGKSVFLDDRLPDIDLPSWQEAQEGVQNCSFPPRRAIVV